MKITKLVKTMGRTINTGNFNSIKIVAELEANLDESDSVEEVDKELYDEISEILARDIERIRKSREESN